MECLSCVRLVRAVVMFVGIVLATNAGASSITGTAIGSFSNVLASNPSGQWKISNNDLTGYAKLEWGVPTQKSNYTWNCFTFNGTGSDIGSQPGSTLAGDLFSLGSFTYSNAMTQQDKVNGADFTIDMNITGYGHAALLFHMAIDNTNDNNDPIASADTVKITNMADYANPFQFSVAGQQYNFQLLGFSRDGGQTFETSVTSLENSQTHAQIYGRITTASPVPLPAAGWLFFSGVTGLILAMRRKRPGNPG